MDFVIYVIHGAAHVSPHSHLGSRRHQIEFPNSTRYLFKAKMDLGSGQHMPQKQACQPQNYDKTFMENMLAKMFTYKDKIFLNKGPGYLCL